MVLDDITQEPTLSSGTGYRLGEEDAVDDDTVVHILPKFDRDFAKKAVGEFAESQKRVYIYDRTQLGDERHIGFFGDWAPTVISGVNNYYGFHLPFREKYTEEYSYSRLAHLLCTLDKSVMFEFENRHTASSKLRNLNACANGLMQEDYGLDYRMLRHVVEERMTSKDVIFEVKMRAMELARKVKMEAHRHIVKHAEPHNYQYVDKLKEIFGNNLEAVMLYGSSAQGEGKDFDNIAILKKIPADLYQKISGIGPALREDGKEVGIIFVAEEVAEKFFYINVSNHLFRNYAKVLYGSINLPIETEDYMVRKERYHAGFGSVKNISGVNMGFKDEDLMSFLFYRDLGIDKPWPLPDRKRKYILEDPNKEGLYEYFVKLPRFTLQGLLFSPEQREMDKTYLLEVLKYKFGYEIQKHQPDGAFVRERLLDAMQASSQVISELYKPCEQQRNNEHIVTIEESISPGIALAHADGQPIWVFKRRRELNPGDNVPAQILHDGDKGYDFRIRKAQQLGLPEGTQIAKRI